MGKVWSRQAPLNLSNRQARVEVENPETEPQSLVLEMVLEFVAAMNSWLSPGVISWFCEAISGFSFGWFRGWKGSAREGGTSLAGAKGVGDHRAFPATE